MHVLSVRRSLHTAWQAQAQARGLSTLNVLAPDKVQKLFPSPALWTVSVVEDLRCRRPSHLLLDHAPSHHHIPTTSRNPPLTTAFPMRDIVSPGAYMVSVRQPSCTRPSLSRALSPSAHFSFCTPSHPPPLTYLEPSCAHEQVARTRGAAARTQGKPGVDAAALARDASAAAGVARRGCTPGRGARCQRPPSKVPPLIPPHPTPPHHSLAAPPSPLGLPIYPVIRLVFPLLLPLPVSCPASPSLNFIPLRPSLFPPQHHRMLCTPRSP